jgi:hypothetical protein
MEKCEEYKLVTEKWSEGETARQDKVHRGLQWNGEGLRVAAKCGAAVCVRCRASGVVCTKRVSCRDLILYDNRVA